MAQPFKKLFYALAVSGLLLVNFVATPVFAVAPTSAEDTLSDSRPSTNANHLIEIDLASGQQWESGETLTIDFPAGFDTTGFANTDSEDYDIEWNGSNKVVVDDGTCAANQIEIDAVNTTNDTFQFSLCAGSTASGAGGDTILIYIGTNADSDGTGDTQIDNPTAGTHSINASSGSDAIFDSKDFLVAVVAGVDISATIDESLTVTINGRTAAQCADNGGSPTKADTTATSIPLGNSGGTPGSVSGNTFYAGCQRVDVGTNAAGGYNVTVRQTQLLTSGGNTIAEGSCDSASCNDTTLGGWEDPNNNGFGYCADDQSGNAAADAGIAAADQCDDGTPLYYTFFTAPAAPTTDFMFSSGPAASDQTNIAYHLSVPGDQAAGTYTNVMVYVATATF